MKVLVVGSGGREHALVASLARSPQKPELLCAPGNAGTAALSRNVELTADTPAGVERLAAFAREERVDLTVVGPEAPLVLGLADVLARDGLRVFGPNRTAARLEGSKAHTKDFLARHEIPSGAFRVFDQAGAAAAYLGRCEYPIVVKADGLAAGKGVVVARDRVEADLAVESMLVERRFGEAGSRVVIEEFLPGSELSLLVVTDGETFLPLETAQDYKQVFDGDRGPNTGGMGCYSPYFPLDHEVVQEAVESIVVRTLAGLRKDGVEFRGVLYVGLMLTSRGPRVLEFNVRFGDPETQAILPRLETDLLEVLDRAARGKLAGLRLAWDARHAVCVVAAAPGYPGKYPTGLPIEGLDDAGGPDVRVYQAGTKQGPGGRTLTAGGRVLAVSALGRGREEAREKAYAAMSRIRFEGMHFRRDVALGDRALAGR